MSYRVIIPTAGIGSRLGKLTKYLNKSLVSISNRPTLCHLIEQFPQDCEFVVALGYKGNLVKDFLRMAYPNREFLFGNVEIYKGEGSGLGLTLLSCEKYLQQPFIFLSCDTLVKGVIPPPNHNWMGYSYTDNISKYRTLKIDNNKVSEIHEKSVSKENLHPYIGIAGINDYKIFWEAMHNGKTTAIQQGESYGMKSILEMNTVHANKFTWFDTGNIESISIARNEYSEPNQPNILEKENEAIWFVGNNVIKYSENVEFINNRVKRAKALKEYVPEIISHNKNMYCYKKVKGSVLSDVVSLGIFEEFMSKCKNFWTEQELNLSDKVNFKNKCLKFYKDKTFERINLFYKNFNQKDDARLINGIEMPSLDSLLNKIDWNWLCDGLPGRFHGDFHFENVLYSGLDKKFIFLDWRQEFAGDIYVGDIYYDLAKLMHGLIINHGIIANENYSASWDDTKINYDFHRKQILVDCEKFLEKWILENNYDLKKVKVLTGLVYLNIAALHHYPYSILLYGLGKKILKSELK